MNSLPFKRIVAVVFILVVVLFLWKKQRRPPLSPTSVPVSPLSEPSRPVAAQGPLSALPPPSVPPKITPPMKRSAPPKQALASSVKPAQVTQSVEPVPSPVFIPPPPPPPSTEWQGNDTAITHPGEVVIHSDRQWVQFWSEHHPHEPAPDVDFAQSMVIGVFAGPRPADQFTIRIVSAQTLADKLLISYQEKLPPPGTFAVNVTVYPYQLKVIPKTSLAVKFNKLAPIDPNRQ